MSLTRYIIALGILASSALGRDMTACMQGVRLALSPFYFTGGNVFDFYESLCANPLRTTSFYASGKIHCSAEEVVAGSALLEYSCLALAGIPAVPYSAVQSNLTDEYINSLPTLTPEDINVKLILTEVYKLDEELFELGVKTYVRGIASIQLETEPQRALTLSTDRPYTPVCAAQEIRVSVPQIMCTRHALIYSL